MTILDCCYFISCQVICCHCSFVLTFQILLTLSEPVPIHRKATHADKSSKTHNSIHSRFLYSLFTQSRNHSLPQSSIYAFTLSFPTHAFDIVIKTKPTMYEINITTSKVFVPFGAPWNSFHTSNPHRMATTGAALLSA